MFSMYYWEAVEILEESSISEKVNIVQMICHRLNWDSERKED